MTSDKRKKALHLVHTDLSSFALGLAGSLLGSVFLVVTSLGRAAALLIGARSSADLGGIGISSRSSLALALAAASRLLRGLGGGLIGSGLELLGNGVLSVTSTLVLGVGGSNAEVISVLDGLLVAHVLGTEVASLVGVDAGVVQTQVVLVSVVPALLLARSHVSPAALALFLNGTLGSLSTKVIGNDVAGMLHVQEVRGQRTLGGIGVVSALLALLLFISRGSRSNNRSDYGRVNGRDQRGSVSLEASKEVDLALGRVLAEQDVSLTNIVVGERLEQINETRETVDGL